MAAGSLLAAPLAAGEQPAGKVWRVGVLGFTPTTSDMVGPEPKSAFAAALLRGLRDLGYVYGQHFVTEPRGAEGRPERYPSLAAELIGLQVDVIVAVSASLPALKQANSTIPIVMPGTFDPVRHGYMKSLSQPGGNFTGLSLQSLEVIGKRLELLNSFRLRRQWRSSGIGPTPQRGRRLKPLPEGEGGNSCRSRFEMSASSRRLSGQRRPRGPARCSWLPAQPSIRTPGESRSWPPRIDCPPCITFDIMSKLVD